MGNGGSLSLDTLLGDLRINLPSRADLANIDISDVLTSLGISLPGNLSLGTVLTDLGFPPSTGDLTLGTLLSDLGISDTLLTGLPGILDLGGLLGDLGLGDLATVSVDPFGGLITELVDLVPSQILAAL